MATSAPQDVLTVLVTGNTFPVKDQLKALGGRWDPTAKGWRVPIAKAEIAQIIVGGKPGSVGSPVRTSGSRGTRTGCRCGSIEEYSKPSDCRQCRFDQDDN
jgi:hypothetical protein